MDPRERSPSACSSASLSAASSSSSSTHSRNSELLCDCADKELWTAVDPSLDNHALGLTTIRAPRQRIASFGIGPTVGSEGDSEYKFDRTSSPTLVHAPADDNSALSTSSSPPLPSPSLSSDSAPSSRAGTPMAPRPPFESITSYSSRCAPPPRINTMRQEADDAPMSASSVRSISSSRSGGSAVFAPTSPPSVPFLPTDCESPGCSVEVNDDDAEQYVVRITLPGFSIENVVLAIKRHGSLHVLADRYADAVRSRPSTATSVSPAPRYEAAHFERMILLEGIDRNASTAASWHGSTLTVRVPRKTGRTPRRSSTASNASSRSMAVPVIPPLDSHALKQIGRDGRRAYSADLRVASGF